MGNSLFKMKVINQKYQRLSERVHKLFLIWNIVGHMQEDIRTMEIAALITSLIYLKKWK
jgi:hypothetical protein